MTFKSINLSLSIAVIFLLSISILVIYSSSPQLAFNQLIFAAIGILIYFFISQFDYKAMKNLIVPLYIIIVLFLLFLAIVGVEVRGVIRWIPLLFFNFQPAEIAKPISALFLAYFWTRNAPSWFNIFKSFLIIAPAVFLIFIQPALGSALAIIGLWLSLLIAIRVSLKKILTLGIIVLTVLPLVWFTLQDYQKLRVLSFLSPQTDPLGHGYNLIQSTIAVGSGQLFGKGLGFGTQSRFQFLPEGRTDFIFASIAEEFGFLGALFLIGVYFLLISYCFKVAHNCEDFFGYLLTIGISSMLTFQIFVNIGMNIGLLPITGITLPLVSYGGSSLISTMISLGLVASVAKFSLKY